MVFKRRDARPLWRIAAEFLWPRTGWKRAFLYVQHRLQRLPDPPERIARGIAAGVFTVFTPFYGLHFVVAAALAKIMRGNLIASLLATFVGNPLTYVPIGVVSLQTGYFLLGMRGFRHGGAPGELPDDEVHRSFGGKFIAAGEDLKDNLLALFTNRDANWHGLTAFYHEIFFPYMIGGLVPGILGAAAAYYVTLPMIRAYQHRRRGKLKAKLAALRAKSEARKADPKGSGKTSDLK